MKRLEADVLIVGSGVAAVAFAWEVLRSSKRSVTIVEAGRLARMAGQDEKNDIGQGTRRWLDFVMRGLEDGDRPYDACSDSLSASAGSGHEFISTDGSALDLADSTGSAAGYPLTWPQRRWETYGARLIAQGGTVAHWGGWSFRLKPEDFHLGSLTGKGIDWPFGYEELAPYYAMAENFLHVAGADGDPNQPDRAGTKYPYKRVPFAKTDEPLLAAFDATGVTYGPLPISRKTVLNPDNPLSEYMENTLLKTPCLSTGTCKYCPWGAIYTPNQTIDYLIDRYPGRFTLHRGHYVEKLTIQNNVITGVEGRSQVDNHQFEIAAQRVVVAGGTLESTKLLQRSGVEHDHLGRHLQVHPLFTVSSEVAGNLSGMQQELHFPTLCSRHYDTPKEQSMGKLLLAKYYDSPELRVEKRLIAGKSPQDINVEFAGNYKYELRGFVETVDEVGTIFRNSSNRDKFGMWGTRFEITGDTYPKKAIKTHLGTMAQIMVKAGFKTQDLKVRVYEPRYDHAVATARMSDDPALGVVDRWHRVYGRKNLFVLSNAVFPNGGVVNPTLTAVALALRFGQSKEWH